MAAFVPNLGGAVGGDGHGRDDDDKDERLHQACDLINQLTCEKNAALAKVEEIQQAYANQGQQLANALAHNNHLEAQLRQNERTREQEQQQTVEIMQQMNARIMPRIMHLEEQLAQKDAQISQLQNQGVNVPPVGNARANQARTAVDEQRRNDLLRSYSPDDWFQRFHEVSPGGGDGSAEETNDDGTDITEGDPAAVEGQ